MKSHRLYQILIITLIWCVQSLSALPATILITGGAGYIGSATTLYLLQQGYTVIVLDKDLQKSKYLATSPVTYVQADFADEGVLTKIFSAYSIDAVIHFAGFTEVGRSCKDPEAFYENNVQKTITLLKVMLKHGIKKFIFSSSAAVYGVPKTDLIQESCLKAPINPYGKTKYMIDLILEDYAMAYQWKAISLRYFNAAGALPAYDIGERHDPETHVIPLLLRAAYAGRPFTIFGDDYTTPDGTCIRDYLHIQDLASAHYLALKYLDNEQVSYAAFNLGTGKGTSIKELVSCASRITGLAIATTITPRRAGDPDRLVADATKAQRLLGWTPTHSSLETILQTAHEFESKKAK